MVAMLLSDLFAKTKYDWTKQKVDDASYASHKFDRKLRFTQQKICKSHMNY